MAQHVQHPNPRWHTWERQMWYGGTTSQCVQLIWNNLVNNQDISHLNLVNSAGQQLDAYGIPDCIIIEFWRQALSQHHSKAYHWLALHTKRHLLFECLKLAFSDVKAMIVLCGAIHHNGLDVCDAVAMIETNSIYYTNVVNALLDCALETLSGRHILDDHCCAARQQRYGPLYAILRGRAKRRLNTFVAATFVVILWRRFVKKTLVPGSSYVMRLSKRWAQNAGQMLQ